MTIADCGWRTRSEMVKYFWLKTRLPSPCSVKASLYLLRNSF
jgi:hypothetical protein